MTKDAGGATSSTATLTITVTGTNDAPVAVGDVAFILEDAVSTSGAVVLGNDTDVDVGDTHAVSAVNGSAGNVECERTGTYGTLRPQQRWSPITYTLNNALCFGTVAGVGPTGRPTYFHLYQRPTTTAASAMSATLTVTVTGTNDVPVAVADTA